MFYFLIIPTFAISIIYLIDFLRIRKHDSVLFQFCDLRRTIMQYLRKNYETITEEEYNYINKILGSTNIAIHDYNELKKKIFDLSHLWRNANLTRTHVLEVESVTPPNNQIIKDFGIAYNRTLLTAFIMYTPVTSIILPPLDIISRFILKYCRRYFNQRMAKLSELVLFFRDRNKKYNLVPIQVTYKYI